MPEPPRESLSELAVVEFDADGMFELLRPALVVGGEQ